MAAKLSLRIFIVLPYIIYNHITKRDCINFGNAEDRLQLFIGKTFVKAVYVMTSVVDLDCKVIVGAKLSTT